MGKGQAGATAAPLHPTLRELREATGQTQEQTARRGNMGLQTYVRLELGRTRDPGKETLEQAAKGLGLPIETLHRAVTATLERAKTGQAALALHGVPTAAQAIAHRERVGH